MKNLIGAVTGAILLAGSASAATLAISGGSPYTLVGGTAEPAFNPAPSVPGIAAGMDVQNDGAQLTLNGTTSIQVTYTYMGKEAAALNVAIDGTSVDTNDAVGTSFTQTYAAGTGILADIFFISQTGEFASNNGPTSAFGAIAFFKLSDTSAYALFDDGTQNIDYDDMIVRIDVAAVPLPAGAALMLTALGGLGVAARRRK